MPAQSRTSRRSSSALAWYPCIGRSASRLRSTRSGVVSSRFLAAGIACLALAAPLPPQALLDRQIRILRLRYRRPKYVQATDVLRPAGDLAELLVHLLRIAPRQLRHGANTEEFEIAQHRRANRNQVAQLPFFAGHKNLLDEFRNFL